MHDNHSNSKMMWWMVIGCALPILLLLFAGESAGSGWFKWAILGVFLLMIVFHFFGMGHGRKKEDLGIESARAQSDKNHNEDSDHSHH